MPNPHQSPLARVIYLGPGVTSAETERTKEGGIFSSPIWKAVVRDEIVNFCVILRCTRGKHIECARVL